MRHDFSARAVPGLPRGMAEATGPAALIAMTGIVERGAPCVLSTRA
jgi:hypothetical protein